MNPSRITSFALLLSLLTHAALAQSVCLPAPRLLTTMPMGGQAGSEFELTISGEFIEGAEQLVFSHPGITANKSADNKYTVKIAADCPTGIHEARVMTRLGLSAARVFTVGKLPEVSQEKHSTTVQSAMPLQLNSICNATMPARGVNHYSIEAKKDQRILVDCAAQGIDSKLNPVLIVGDKDGNDLQVERRGGVIDFLVPDDGTYTIKVHDLTFNGGEHYFYRLVIQELPGEVPVIRQPATRAVAAHSWPPFGLPPEAPLKEHDSEDAQKLNLPCDIAGSFFPAADVDTYEFEAKKGEQWWIEVASQRLGRPTDASVVVQRVSKDGDTESLVDVAELSDIPSPVKVSSNGYSYDGPPYNAGSSDVLGKIEIPEDGTYRLQVTDLFGGTRNDPNNIYRLVIRQATPDFSVVAWALHMNLRNGDRNALSKPIALRRGWTMPLEVIVIRRDGFDGEIELIMENLPDGVNASGTKIPAGKSRGIMLITADEGAPKGYANATFRGRAKIGDQTVTRPCQLASMAWPVRNAWSEIPSPRLLSSIAVSVSDDETAPITIAAKERKVWEAKTGEKLTIPLLHMRRGEFSGKAINMSTFGSPFESFKFDLPLDADSSEAIMDLAKTPPGEYLIALYGSAVSKHRHNVAAITVAEQEHTKAQETAAALAAEVTRLSEQAKVASGQAKTEAEKSLAAVTAEKKAADAAVAAAEKRVAAAKSQANPKDIVDIIVSEPIKIRVQPAETK